MVKTNTNSRVQPTVFARNVQTLSKCWTQRFSGKMEQIAGLHIHVHILYIYILHTCTFCIVQCRNVCSGLSLTRQSVKTPWRVDLQVLPERLLIHIVLSSDATSFESWWTLEQDSSQALWEALCTNFEVMGDLFSNPSCRINPQTMWLTGIRSAASCQVFSGTHVRNKKHMPCWWVSPKSNRCACCGCCCFCYIFVFLLDECCGISMLFAWYCRCHAFLPFHTEDM